MSVTSNRHHREKCRQQTNQLGRGFDTTTDAIWNRLNKGVRVFSLATSACLRTTLIDTFSGNGRTSSINTCKPLRRQTMETSDDLSQRWRSIDMAGIVAGDAAWLRWLEWQVEELSVNTPDRIK